MTPAKLIAKNVFPSPEIVDVIAIILGPGSFEINWRFVLITLKDSAIIDFGFLSTINWETGMSNLYFGIIPITGLSVNLIISSKEAISL